MTVSHLARLHLYTRHLYIQVALDHTKILSKLDISYTDEDRMEHYVKACEKGGGRLCFVKTPFVNKSKGAYLRTDTHAAFQLVRLYGDAL